MPRQAELTLIDVVVGVITDDQDRVLIQQRTDGPFAGQWEFPGGKRETAEGSFDALSRELHEENGIDVVRASPLIHITHHYPDRAVSLRTFFIDRYRGTPSGAEGQAVKWVTRRALFDEQMLAADRPVSVAINLPHEYLMTPPVSSEAEVPAFVDALDAALVTTQPHDRRLMCLRAPQFDPDAYERLARLTTARCHSAGVELMLHGGAERVPLVRELGAHGLHLSLEHAKRLSGRPIDADLWLAVSAQASADLAHAQRLGADFATLGGVLSRAAPDTEAHGWPGFSECVGQALLPVYARGGLRGADAAQARAQGGQGVAITRELWGRLGRV